MKKRKTRKRVKKAALSFPLVVEVADPNVQIPEQVQREVARATLLYTYVHGPKTFDENAARLMHELKNVVEKFGLLLRTTQYHIKEGQYHGGKVT
jgi:hypothetical protein